MWKKSRKAFYNKFTQPRALMITWLSFLLSPSLGLFRKFYLENKTFYVSIPGVSTILYYLPYLITIFAVLVQIVWARELVALRLKKKHRNAFILMSVMSLVFIIISQRLLNLQLNNYPNYIYSMYGIPSAQLQFMNFVALLELVVFVAFIVMSVRFKPFPKIGRPYSNVKFTNSKLSLNRKSNSQKVSLLISFISISALFALSPTIFLNLEALVGGSRQGYESKVGKDYKYIEMLVNASPQDSNIIHPPQSNTWPAIGNQPLIRFFLYPRTLISGAIIDNNIFTKDIKTAYFAFIDDKSTNRIWPLINFKDNQIMFNESDFVSFKEIELVVDSEKGKMYKINF